MSLICVAKLEGLSSGIIYRSYVFSCIGLWLSDGSILDYSRGYFLFKSFEFPFPFLNSLLELIMASDSISRVEFELLGRTIGY
jgi:hypothetical protein